jgi:hypothetical protein
VDATIRNAQRQLVQCLLATVTQVEALGLDHVMRYRRSRGFAAALDPNEVR